MRTTLLKTHPRQSLIHKLFTSLATSPFGSARPYGQLKNSLTLAAWRFYLHELFRVEPHIFSFLGTDSTSLGFRLFGRYKHFKVLRGIVI